MIASVALWRDREQKQQYLTILLKTKASGKKAARIWQQNGNAAVLSRETDGLKIRWPKRPVPVRVRPSAVRSKTMSPESSPKRMRNLEISETDLEESFARSSGPGGQNVNKVSTAVTLRYLPTGISVTVQDSRSQVVNRKLARERLLDAIESARDGQRMAEIAKREKERRRKSPRPASLKRKILESKRKRAELKKQRTKIKLD